jgi:hypothetical protein
MADITFSAGMDSSGMEKAYQTMIRENGKLREELTKLATQSREAADKDREYKRMQIESIKRLKTEQEGLAAAAAKIMESVQTPFERYKKSAGELREHLQAGRISTDAYRISLSNLASEYKKAEANTEKGRLATEKARQAQAAETAAVREAAGVIDSTRTKQERYALAIEKLNRLRRAGKIDAETHARATKAETDALDEGKAKGFAERMGEVASGVLSANMAMAAGQKAIQLLREEYERLIERQSKMASAQISLAAAQENALANLDTTMTPKDFLNRMRTESQNLGMSEKDLTNAAANALSAKGDKTAADAVDAVVAASKFRRFGSAEEQAGLAGTALDLGKAFGMNAEESLGFLAKAQGPSRVVSAKGMAENIAPAIIGAQQFGVSGATAASMAAALTSSSVDTTGAQTKTSLISLLAQLREFGKAEKGFVGGPEYDAKIAEIEAQYELHKKDKTKGIDKATKEKLVAQETGKLQDQPAFEMFVRMQEDPALRQKFFAEKTSGGFGASFEKQMLPAIEGLLTPGTQTSKEYFAASDVMMKGSNQEAFDRQIAMKQASDAIGVSTLDQGLGNIRDQIELSDPEQARSGVIRDRMKEIRDALGRKGLTTRAMGYIDDAVSGGKQNIDTAIEGLQKERDRVRLPSMSSEERQRLGFTAPMTPGFGAVETLGANAAPAPAVNPRELTPGEQKQVMLLEKAVEALEKMQAQQNGNVNAGAAVGRRMNQGEAGP